MFKTLKEKIARSRKGFIRQLDGLFLGKQEISPEILEEIEEILVMADMGVATVENIIDRLRKDVDRGEIADSEALRNRLKTLIKSVFPKGGSPLEDIEETVRPFVILVVGVNGVGKTTTIAKLAWRFKKKGKEVVLVAADTFRAAAVEQLQKWGERLNAPVISQRPGADPSAVAFDGIQAAISKGAEVCIVDTAGRLHTQVNLMKELQKIKRVINKKMEGAPHETLLVLDATTGQNALSQAKTFCEATDVTGIVLTKLDGTAKGGIVASIANELNIPVKYIGVGEQMEDLRPFDPDQFVEALFEE